MWLTEECVKATEHMKEEEVQRDQVISEAGKQAQQNRNARVCWRVLRDGGTADDCHAADRVFPGS